MRLPEYHSTIYLTFSTKLGKCRPIKIDKVNEIFNLLRTGETELLHWSSLAWIELKTRVLTFHHLIKHLFLWGTRNMASMCKCIFMLIPYQVKYDPTSFIYIIVRQEFHCIKILLYCKIVIKNMVILWYNFVEILIYKK